MQNWEFLCEHCNDDGVNIPMQISYQGHDGTLLDAKERDQRVAKAKLMQVTSPSQRQKASLFLCKNARIQLLRGRKWRKNATSVGLLWRTSGMLPHAYALHIRAALPSR